MAEPVRVKLTVPVIAVEALALNVNALPSFTELVLLTALIVTEGND